VRTDLEKSWKTQGILKFGKIIREKHGISQNIHGILIKYP